MGNRGRLWFGDRDAVESRPSFLILLVASWLRRHQGEAIEYLRAENRVLRGRVGPKRLRFNDAERRLLGAKGKPLGRKLLGEVASLATPDTILRWYRERVAAKYDGSRTRCFQGRPRSHRDKIAPLLTMARDNPSWGYTRLRGELENLGLDLGRSTIARILKENGIEGPEAFRARPARYGRQPLDGQQSGQHDGQHRGP
jgi:hypothetical protein